MSRRLKENKGNSVIVLGIFFVALILLCAVLIVDLTKAYYVKNAYSSYARKAAQTAIKQQDLVGGLKPESAQVLVDEYLIQRGGGGVNTRETSAHSVNCDKLGKYPIIEITYDNKRGKDASSETYTSVNGSEISIPRFNKFFQNQYNTIEVNITDVTDNYFFGIFGKPCAVLHVRASGIATSSYDEDEIRINK